MKKEFLMFGALAMLGSMGGGLSARAVDEDGEQLDLFDYDRMQELQDIAALQIEDAVVSTSKPAKVTPARYAPLPEMRLERKEKSSSLKAMLGRKGRA
jgi:hypothetical protein